MKPSARTAMRRLALVLVIAGMSPAWAADKAKPAPAKTPKSRVYTFTGLDVEGKLKTPQLLFFLNRVKLELDTTSPEKRSFMKELEKSSDDKGL